MNNKKNIINQYNEKISSYVETGDYQTYLVTTLFNMTNHVPDDVESNLLNQIKHTKKHNPSSCVLPELYRELSDHRFKINKSLNRRIYEKDITLQRLTWCWNQYDIFQTHLVKTLIKNAGRPSKIKLYPRTWDFVDVFGSKHGNEVWYDDFSIHLHSIYVDKNEIADKFDRLVAGQFHEILWHPKLNGVRAVHGEAVGGEAADLANVIEYAGKFALGIDPPRRRDDLPLSFQYPITGEERLLKRQHAQFLAAA